MIRHPAENSSSLQQDVSRLWTHLVDLGALQCRLFAVEFRRSSASLQKAVLLTITGGVLLMAAVPLLLAAGALQLSASAELPLAASLAIVAVIAMVLMSVAMIAGYRIARRSAKALISPVRDLELNLRSLAGEPASTVRTSASSSDPYPNGAE
ncbi:phage holin family protein [Botrimarina mediterranea]|uniref:Phage holin family protein n=1 Tax=Botrimarina mediterranea TaxID=2528022 RepID=A0A518K372_9BACT|nr:phage holin family protein [Botrimarina mediterranea]QDV72253.1 hypothetical protein Spa11_04260 [Botrimarina mediterranea]QDV76797.1 hypothetical protein K2D_03790 [Planctomycetes bacterium K2D]